MELDFEVSGLMGYAVLGGALYLCYRAMRAHNAREAARSAQRQASLQPANNGYGYLL